MVKLDMRNGVGGPGSMAKVIFEPTGKYAYKLFKSPDHPDHKEQPPKESEIRTVFASELDA
ncbi:MAG: hypothetical protein WCS42_19660 [Verrucomicrobiota bacterium]